MTVGPQNGLNYPEHLSNNQMSAIWMLKGCFRIRDTSDEFCPFQTSVVQCLCIHEKWISEINYISDKTLKNSDSHQVGQGRWHTSFHLHRRGNHSQVLFLVTPEQFLTLHRPEMWGDYPEIRISQKTGGKKKKLWRSFLRFFFSCIVEQYKSSPHEEFLEKIKARCSEKSSLTNTAFWWKFLPRNK